MSDEATGHGAALDALRGSRSRIEELLRERVGRGEANAAEVQALRELDANWVWVGCEEIGRAKPARR